MHAISSSAMSQAWLCLESWESGARSYQGIGSWYSSTKVQDLSVKPSSASARQWELTQPQENRLSLKQKLLQRFGRDEKVKFLNIWRYNMLQMQSLLAIWLAWKVQQQSMLHPVSEWCSVERTCDVETKIHRCFILRLLCYPEVQEYFT